MAKFNQKEIREFALKLIASRPEGIRYSQLVNEIVKASPETPKNTVHGSVWDLDARFPNKVNKPTRGLFKAFLNGDSNPEKAAAPIETAPSLKEEHFYESFGDFLKGELNEVKEVVALGGAGLKAKWGTPDVIGIYKPSGADLIQFPKEIVSAEIKIDPYQPVVAFGQAAAYRLFSNRVYVVMPSSIGPEDLGRLEALCMLYGIGLVLFDLNVEDPSFSIRVRSQRFSPDMFYVNEFATGLHKHNPDKFEELFG